MTGEIPSEEKITNDDDNGGGGDNDAAATSGYDPGPMKVSVSSSSSSCSSSGGGSWSNLVELKTLLLHHNKLEGILPKDFLQGLSSSLEELDLGNNLLVGSIPSSIGKMTKLERFDVHSNQFNGTLPSEMNRMYPDVQLNLTDNL